MLGVAVIVAAVLAFHVWSDPLAYATVLLLVWAAIRFRIRGVSTAALVMAVIADWAIARMTGPLVDLGQSTSTTVLILQMFVGVSLLGLLFLAAALDERDIADAHRRGADRPVPSHVRHDPGRDGADDARRCDPRCQPCVVRDVAPAAQGAAR